LHSVIPLLVDEGDWFENGVLVGSFSLTGRHGGRSKKAS
jgi:hypothetical protein